MYKNYIFDLYGTLADISTNENKSSLWKYMAELYGLYGAYYKPQELKKQYGAEVEKEKQRVKEKDTEVRFIDVKLENVFNALLQNKGVEPTQDFAFVAAKLFRITSTKYIKPYDGAVDLLKTLKASGKNVYLLTNAQRMFTQQELVLMGLYSYFDGIVISSDEECCKPDYKFYDTIFKRYNLNKEESIMIGNDYITDIKGSYDYGIDSCYIHANISPAIKGKLLAKYSVMDGDVYKIKELIIKK